MDQKADDLKSRTNPPAPSQNNKPPDPGGAAKATAENDLSTGHSTPGDGGDDNAS